MKLTGVSVALAAVLSLRWHEAAQHPTAMRDSLKGVGEISVVVDFAPDALAKERLSQDDREARQILGRVERKLRRGGLAANPIFTDPHPSGLEVRVEITCSKALSACAVGASVRLTQSVTVAQSGKPAIATTWHDEQTAILSLEEMTGALSGLDGMLDNLVRDWQTANTKGR